MGMSGEMFFGNRSRAADDGSGCDGTTAFPTASAAPLDCGIGIPCDGSEIGGSSISLTAPV